MKRDKKQDDSAAVRCAIYTRKSTEEGLEQEFNSLDAQRESAEALIKSQVHEGWECLPDRYDDGGFTGGNMERPALKRLVADIEAGKIDCVVVYKVDRLSRSLLDFSRIMETFDRRRISFVSVTQQFNTSTSMGRLILNVLFSFAQFEREMISERTRDKMGAARRKGKYVGGVSVLGYDVDHDRKKLVVNDDEAERVRRIFDLYLEYEAMLPVVKELAVRRWTNKYRTTRKGTPYGGKPFTKNSLHKLLTNVVYLGQVRHRDETYAGEQAAIVQADVWQRVQTLLKRNFRSGGKLGRNKRGALLKGLLRCKNCNCAMSLMATSKKGTKKYRYYVCNAAQHNGWHTCPSKSIPAGEIERFVVDQIRAIGSDPSLAAEVIAQAVSQAAAERAALDAERRGLERDLGRYDQELQTLAQAGHTGRTAGKLADLQGRIATAEARLNDVRLQISQSVGAEIDPDEAVEALRAFDPVWETLSPREQAKVIQLLVARVEYDGAEEKVTMVLNIEGLGIFAEQTSESKGAA